MGAEAAYTETGDDYGRGRGRGGDWGAARTSAASASIEASSSVGIAEALPDQRSELGASVCPDTGLGRV